MFGTYEFDSNICGFTLEITNLPSQAIGVMDLDRSVMKLTAADGRGEYGDFTLILVSEQPDDSLLNKAAASDSNKEKSFGPEDFLPFEISFERADVEKQAQ